MASHSQSLFPVCEQHLAATEYCPIRQFKKNKFLPTRTLDKAPYS